MKKKKIMPPTMPEFCGTTNIGERGQVVIPKEAREALGILPGDTMVSMIHNHALILFPKKHMESFVKALAKKFNI
jgi:AbrB family looped-hinge helix DNA binding protein